MSNTVGGIRDRIFSTNDGRTDDEVREALASYLAPDEPLEHTFEGSSGLRHEHEGEVEEVPVANDAGSFVAVTDRQLIIAVVSPQGDVVIDIPFRELKGIDVDDGLLRSKLTVDVWYDGTYTLKTKDSRALANAVPYIDSAAETWQYVTSVLEEINDELRSIADHLEQGRRGDAHTTREQCREKLKRVASYLEESDLGPVPPLVERIKTTRDELTRTEIQARIARAKTLVTEAEYQADAGEYTGAYDRYWEARDQLENARMLARKAEIEEPPLIESELETIETRLANLRVRPLAQAKQARERATHTENLETRVEALEKAVHHYQNALTAGWGTNYEFAGEQSQIRFTIELLVSELIEASIECANELIDRGDEHQAGDDPRSATRAYEQARDHCQRAAQLSREFRAGDPAALEPVRDRLATRLE